MPKAPAKAKDRIAAAKEARSAAAAAAKADKDTKRKLAAERRRKRDPTYMHDAAEFRKQLAALGLVIRESRGDGNCLFRSISDQLYGNEAHHVALRHQCCDFLLEHTDDFAPFLLEEDGFESFDAYVENMRELTTWGGNLELQALSLKLNINIIVHQLAQPRWEIRNNFHPRARQISLSYHDGDHYNSVRLLTDDTDAPATSIDYEGLTPVAGAVASLKDAEADKIQQILACLPRANRPKLETVRELLKTMEGDTDAVIEVLIAKAFKDDDDDDEIAVGEPPPLASSDATSSAAPAPRIPPSTDPPRRNGPCPCGSGAVYRRCCQSVDLAARARTKALQEKEASKSAADTSSKPRRKPRRATEDAHESEDEILASVAAVRI